MDVSDIFCFFCSGEGLRVAQEAGEGERGRFLMENPRRESPRRVGAGGARGREGCLRGNLGGGGGAKLFFFGAEIPTNDFK